MKILIYDPTSFNHYLAINAIYKIYSCNPSNSFKIIVTPFIAQFLNGLIEERTGKCELLIKEKDEDLRLTLLHTTQNWQPDRLHIISLDSNFNDYTKYIDLFPVYLSIHKYNYWFPDSIFSSINTVIKLSGLAINRNFLKTLITEAPKTLANELNRVQFVKSILKNTNLKFIGHGPVVYDCLIKQFKKERIVHIPFSIYEDLGGEKKNSTQPIRLVIPGSVEESRRKYKDLFSAMSNEMAAVKDLFEIYLLGKMAPASLESKSVDIFRSAGFKVTAWERPVSEKEFVQSMNSCHFIIGNLNVESGFYDKFSETGVVFNMIRFGKPGFLPEGLKTYKSLASSVKRFSNYKDLCRQLSELIISTSRIETLINNAEINSKEFFPEKFEIL